MGQGQETRRARELDLDADRAARAEANGEPPRIKLGGEWWTLPLELPFKTLEDAIRSDDTEGVMRLLLGDQYEAFMAKAPTTGDIRYLDAHFMDLYGVSTGESSASGGPSGSTGDRSRPTSSGSTGSTSGKRRTGRTR